MSLMLSFRLLLDHLLVDWSDLSMCEEVGMPYMSCRIVIMLGFGRRTRGLNSLTVRSCAFCQGTYALNVQEMQTGEA
jgi:hypothetical protein